MRIQDVQNAVDHFTLTTGYFPGGVLMNRGDVYDICMNQWSPSYRQIRVGPGGTAHGAEYFEICGARVIWDREIEPGQVIAVSDPECYALLSGERRDRVLSDILNQSSKRAWRR